MKFLYDKDLNWVSRKLPTQKNIDQTSIPEILKLVRITILVLYQSDVGLEVQTTPNISHCDTPINSNLGNQSDKLNFPYTKNQPILLKLHRWHIQVLESMASADYRFLVA